MIVFSILVLLPVNAENQVQAFKTISFQLESTCIT